MLEQHIQLHKFVASIDKDPLHTDWHVSELCHIIQTLNESLGELIELLEKGEQK